MKRILLWLGGAFLSVGVAAVVLEIGLRATGYSEPIWYQADEQLGWTLRPGARGRFTSEGGSSVWISPAGMRDRSHAPAKPRGVYRIAVLGDAYAEAMQVEFRDTFWWQLEDKLAACDFRGGTKVEVLNFGVRGYGLAQSLAMLQSRAMHYAPDLVLLAYSGADALQREGVRVLGLRPPWSEVLWAGADRFRWVQFAHEQYHRIGEHGRLHASAERATPKPELLRNMKQAAARGGADFAVALIHRQPELEQAGRRLGVAMIPLHEEMKSLSQARALPFHGFRKTGFNRGHWNADGHRAASDLIARHLCQTK